MKLHQQIIQLLHLKNGFQMILPFPMRCLYHSAGEEKNQSMKYRAAGHGFGPGRRDRACGQAKMQRLYPPGRGRQFSLQGILVIFR